MSCWSQHSGSGIVAEGHVWQLHYVYGCMIPRCSSAQPCCLCPVAVCMSTPLHAELHLRICATDAASAALSVHQSSSSHQQRCNSWTTHQHWELKRAGQQHRDSQRRRTCINWCCCPYWDVPCLVVLVRQGTRQPTRCDLLWRVPDSCSCRAVIYACRHSPRE